VTSPPTSDRWRTYDPAGLPRVLETALSAFAEHGYHGTTVRDLAGGSGLSVPGIYHHYSSKQVILSELMMTIMDELIERSREALASVDGTPTAEFDILVESLLRFHMARRQQAFVATSEIRSLDEENRVRYVARRDEQQRMMDAIVAAGVDEGVFTTPYPRDASRAVVSLCVGVASWYSTEGELSQDAILERYGDIARAIVGRR
jgi:AcrR family transcriptional regulator